MCRYVLYFGGRDQKGDQREATPNRCDQDSGLGTGENRNSTYPFLKKTSGSKGNLNSDLIGMWARR